MAIEGSVIGSRMTADDLQAQVVRAQSGDQAALEQVVRAIMNGRCLRVGQEFLALVDYKESGLVVKLSQRRVDELIASGIGQPFSPAGRRFKEWMSVVKPDRRRWRALLRESVASRKGSTDLA